jgi:hypothetical protein
LCAGLRGRVGSWYLLQERPAKVELGDDSLRVQTPECVGVDDAHIDQPPGEGRPVLHALPLYSIVLPELIYSIHMTLVIIVVEYYLRLGDGRGMVGTTVLRDGGHGIDPMMCAKHQHRLLVQPHQAAKLTALPCLRLTLTQ